MRSSRVDVIWIQRTPAVGIQLRCHTVNEANNASHSIHNTTIRTAYSLNSARRRGLIAIIPRLLTVTTKLHQRATTVRLGFSPCNYTSTIQHVRFSSAFVGQRGISPMSIHYCNSKTFYHEVKITGKYDNVAFVLILSSSSANFACINFYDCIKTCLHIAWSELMTPIIIVYAGKICR